MLLSFFAVLLVVPFVSEAAFFGVSIKRHMKEQVAKIAGVSVDALAQLDHDLLEIPKRAAPGEPLRSGGDRVRSAKMRFKVTMGAISKAEDAYNRSDTDERPFHALAVMDLYRVLVEETRSRFGNATGTGQFYQKEIQSRLRRLARSVEIHPTFAEAERKAIAESGHEPWRAARSEERS
ncbi:MAG: hypothetical protein IH936_07765 [Acidobacteria bacterium]|nr:hypothetical protein [Acidobacteriota bacterium]